jgi:hypothetical protein
MDPVAIDAGVEPMGAQIGVGGRDRDGVDIQFLLPSAGGSRRHACADDRRAAVQPRMVAHVLQGRQHLKILVESVRDLRGLRIPGQVLQREGLALANLRCSPRMAGCSKAVTPIGGDGAL